MSAHVLLNLLNALLMYFVGLMFYVPANSYGDVETVSSLNHIFLSWESLT